MPVYDFTCGKLLTYLDKYFDYTECKKAPDFFIFIFRVTTQLSLRMDTPPYLPSSYTPPFPCTASLYSTYDFMIYESQQTLSIKTEQTDTREK